LRTPQLAKRATAHRPRGNVGVAANVPLLLPTGLRRTLTWDQGNEMFQHARIEQATGLRIYFADPHSPWQRGTNENTNGLLRQYLPKSTDPLGSYPRPELNRIAAELNDRPRLYLNDRAPAQLMRRCHLRATAQIRGDP
jgi:transposase, IS30 family